MHVFYNILLSFLMADEIMPSAQCNHRDNEDYSITEIETKSGNEDISFPPDRTDAS
jgi:hypothetical protein